LRRRGRRRRQRGDGGRRQRRWLRGRFGVARQRAWVKGELFHALCRDEAAKLVLVDKLHQLSAARGPQRGVIQAVGRLRLLPAEQEPLLGVGDVLCAFAAGRVLTAGLSYATGKVHCAVAAFSALDKVFIYAPPCVLSRCADRQPWHAQPLRKSTRAQHRDQNHVVAVCQRGAIGAPRLRVSALGC
jgi:hypothetical protein